MNQLIYLIFLFLYFIELIKCIDIQLLFYPNGFNEDYIDYIVKEFNSYSVINDLNIKLVKNLYSSVTTAESYSETIEYLLNLKSSKYDMILFDMIDSKRLRKHFSNLKDYLLESTVEKFKDGLTNETYFINDNFVSMPMYLEYDMLYSNQNYMDKYNKLIPKTWNELIETAKYIISEEEKDNNDIIGYTADISGR
ncbi:hypothetical protein H8356DRAFT_1081047 [Neocallimastix lanati (nom. inval.)]|uniref:Periplasmic binding protein-like II n=1 Tax=Neocallimastix californiae TaxID=1754190 RepID=A0A1Y1ZHY1_9FUNG|nr:hypothetical protein H8356DRAFT_1081047 [Neocallimastix sp. JGI-2020a]ORY09627.1 hypothetical protein LY90DRAFT_518847 [Neocallimastix californiae]|eukprot:ORY09627.1 hypothetical protein LY90DRAFT_518847 [Neocallimastix californiae]